MRDQASGPTGRRLASGPRSGRREALGGAQQTRLQWAGLVAHLADYGSPTAAPPPVMDQFRHTPPSPPPPLSRLPKPTGGPIGRGARHPPARCLAGIAELELAVRGRRSPRQHLGAPPLEREVAARAVSCNGDRTRVAGTSRPPRRGPSAADARSFDASRHSVYHSVSTVLLQPSSTSDPVGD